MGGGQRQLYVSNVCDPLSLYSDIMQGEVLTE